MHCIADLLRLSTDYLTSHHVDEARTKVELVMGHLLACKRLNLLVRQNDPFPEAQLDALRGALRRLKQGEPVQYVLGEWDFHDITLRVDARALIPRPETEDLVDRVLTRVRQRATTPSPVTHIADIGTGTGAIILSLAYALREQDIAFTAVDLSPEALTLARENAQWLHLADRVTFVQGDACAPLEAASIDLLVSNPPYISATDTDALPAGILTFEPRLALDGGPDGLSILRRITMQATQVLRPAGEVYYEHGDEQGPLMRRILETAGFSHVQIIKDFAGLDRFATGILQ